MFKDEAERKAHDIICIIRFGSPGGRADMRDVVKVANVIRGGPLPAAPVAPLPIKALEPPPVPPLPRNPNLVLPPLPKLPKVNL